MCFVKKVWEGVKEWRMGLITREGVVSRGNAAGMQVGREEWRAKKFNGDEKKKILTRIQGVWVWLLHSRETLKTNDLESKAGWKGELLTSVVYSGKFHSTLSVFSLEFMMWETKAITKGDSKFGVCITIISLHLINWLLHCSYYSLRCWFEKDCLWKMVLTAPSSQVVVYGLLLLLICSDTIPKYFFSWCLCRLFFSQSPVTFFYWMMPYCVTVLTNVTWIT